MGRIVRLQPLLSRLYSDFKQSPSGHPCKLRPVPYVHRDCVQRTYSLEPLEADFIS